MTNQHMQDVFDVAVDHLLTQMKASVIRGACAYRGTGGLMCAIGCLISDTDYTPDMEGYSVTKLFYADGFAGRPSIERLRKTDHKFLCHLQNIHDRDSVESWPEQLKKLAKIYDLEYKGV